MKTFCTQIEQRKVFILYGLRRTGKTTMIRQIFAEMSNTDLGKAAFIKISAKTHWQT